MQNASALILGSLPRRTFSIPCRDSSGVFFLRLRRRDFAENPRMRREGSVALSCAWGVSAAVAAAAATARANGGGRDVERVCQHTVQRWRSIPSLGQARAFTPRCSPGDTESRIVARLSRQAGYWPGVGAWGGLRGRRVHRLGTLPSVGCNVRSLSSMSKIAAPDCRSSCSPATRVSTDREDALSLLSRSLAATPVDSSE